MLPLDFYMFRKSLSTGIVPNEWKIANVSAIFKKGNKSEPGNFRPISLTCVLCKLCESIIKDNIMLHLEMHNMISDCQHGFRNNRSCITQLLQVMEDFTYLMDNKKNIDVIYLDFSKAFDSVPHQRLYVKLKAYGIAGDVFTWIRSYLSNRRQRVVVGNDVSDLEYVGSGVPQGSVLGPVLFLLYINDIPDCVDSQCRLFADDTKIYSTDNNWQYLQNDLFALFRWSLEWQLPFNISKCKTLHIGRTNQAHNYHMNDEECSVLSVTESEKDLGVVFDGNLNFDIHINGCINRAIKMIGMIFRSFEYMNVPVFITLYTSLVRPILEYGNCIWSPMFKRQSVALENVQRRATRLLSMLKYHNMSYEERLKYLNLPSLKYRRKRGDLIQLYKLVHSIDNIECGKFFNYSHVKYTRGDKFKILIKSSSTSVRRNSFIFRTVATWNNLKFETKNCNSMNGFKNAVDGELGALKYAYDE